MYWPNLSNKPDKKRKKKKIFAFKVGDKVRISHL